MNTKKSIALLFIALLVCSCFAGIGSAVEKSTNDYLLINNGISFKNYNFEVVGSSSKDYHARDVIFGMDYINKDGKRINAFQKEYDFIKNGIILGTFSDSMLNAGPDKLIFWIRDSSESATVDNNYGNNEVFVTYLKHSDFAVKAYPNSLKNKVTIKLSSKITNPGVCDVKLYISGKCVYIWKNYDMMKKGNAISYSPSVRGKAYVEVVSIYEKDQTKGDNKAYFSI